MDKTEELEQIKRHPEVARAYRKLYPHHSTCGICGLPWSVAKPHHVNLGNGKGCFAVCERCWGNAKHFAVLWRPHVDAYVDGYAQLSPKEREAQMEQDTIEHRLYCVKEDFLANRKK